jgi:D-alanyl-D-alanine carboxypeptidase
VASALALFIWAVSVAEPAARASTPPSVRVPPLPKAWILVDAASGAVLDAQNARVALPPASVTKLLTAVIAAQTIQLTDTLTVSARAAGEPARKIGMKTGEVWTFKDSLYCLLLSSANDAAVGIGERIGGSLENFAAIMASAAHELGLADNPVLQDPAGLDDATFSVGGGNLLSARDLAIIMRAALAQPAVAAAMGTNIYRFVGPDGFHHRLTNHIHSFLTGYPGAIGGKPGFTDKAGSTLVLAAQRGDRRLISVVLGAPDPYGSGIALLDRGFSLPPGQPGANDTLPPVHLPGPAGAAAASAASGLARPAPPAPAPVATIGHRSGGLLGPLSLVVLVLLLMATMVAARRRDIRRRRARRLAALRAGAGRPTL